MLRRHFIAIHTNIPTLDTGGKIEIRGGKMLSTEVRELMVKAYEKSHNATEVARNFSVSRGTVYEYVNRKKNNESLEVKTNQRGRKSKLTPQNLNDIKCAIEEQPDITIHEITEKLALPVSEETVRREVVKMGFVYKKKSMHASERERSRCKRKAKCMD